jgi:putative FmdB family regulatory protein
VPTYAYACTECDNRFEQHQSFSDAALTECPQCSGRLRKVFNSVGVVFKGSGFYRTDSRADARSTSGEAKSESKAEPKGETKSDAKNGSTSKDTSSTSSGSGGSSAGSSASGSSGSKTSAA